MQREDPTDPLNPRSNVITDDAKAGVFNVLLTSVSQIKPATGWIAKAVGSKESEDERHRVVEEQGRDYLRKRDASKAGRDASYLGD